MSGSSSSDEPDSPIKVHGEKLLSDWGADVDRRLDTLARFETVLIGQSTHLEQLEATVQDLIKEKDVLAVTVQELTHDRDVARGEINYLNEKVEEAHDKCTTLMRAVSGSQAARKIKPPNPRSFSGVRDAKEVDNFLFDMEQYFRACEVEETQKVDTTSMFLTDDAKLWWRSKYADIEAGRIRIDTWATLKEELKRQFYPENTDFLARKKLKSLKHTNCIRDYVREYSACMLEVRDMSEKDRLFNFVFGLKEWAQRELARQKIDTLAQTITVAKRLSDFPQRRTRC